MKPPGLPLAEQPWCKGTKGTATVVAESAGGASTPSDHILVKQFGLVYSPVQLLAIAAGLLKVLPCTPGFLALGTLPAIGLIAMESSKLSLMLPPI